MTAGRAKRTIEALAEIIGSLIGMAIALTAGVVVIAFVLLVIGKLVGLV